MRFRWKKIKNIHLKFLHKYKEKKAKGVISPLSSLKSTTGGSIYDKTANFIVLLVKIMKSGMGRRETRK